MLLKKISFLFLILTIAWMGCIFYFSSQDGDESSQDSMDVGLLVARIVVSDFDQWSEDEQIAFAQKIDHPIRKMAHALEYAVLGFLVYMTYKDWKVALLVCILYACSDEFHQLFVKGRSGQISDVILDSCGAFVCILCVKLLGKRIEVFK